MIPVLLDRAHVECGNLLMCSIEVDSLRQHSLCSDGFCGSGEMSCKEIAWKVLCFSCCAKRKSMLESIKSALPATSSPASLCVLQWHGCFPIGTSRRKMQSWARTQMWCRLCPQQTPCRIPDIGKGGSSYQHCALQSCLGGSQIRQQWAPQKSL